MSVQVFAICWNEAYLIPHWVRHYRQFSDSLVIYDNGSTDGSQDIARSLGCDVRHYDTNGQQDNEAMRVLKSTCWMGSKHDWIVVCDMDEFLIAHENLAFFRPTGGLIEAPIFRCEAHQMLSESPPEDFQTVHKAVRAEYFDKCLCFSSAVKEMNYTHGCHDCKPEGGTIVPGVLKLYHYNFLGEQYVVDRWKRYVPRMSENDMINHWGEHYLHPEDAIRRMWQEAWSNALEIHPVSYLGDRAGLQLGIRPRDVPEPDQGSGSGPAQ